MWGSKTALHEVVTRHHNTLRDVRSSKISRRDIAQAYGLPLAVGAIAWWRGFHFEDLGAITAGVAILTGLLFALVIFVFQLRLGAKDDATSLRTRLDELFYNVLYAIGVGVVTTVVSVVTDSVNKDGSIGIVGSLAVIGFGSHLIVTMAMIVKRVMRAYQALT